MELEDKVWADEEEEESREEGGGAGGGGNSRLPLYIPSPSDSAKTRRK